MGDAGIMGYEFFLLEILLIGVLVWQWRSTKKDIEATRRRKAEEAAAEKKQDEASAADPAQNSAAEEGAAHMAAEEGGDPGSSPTGSTRDT